MRRTVRRSGTRVWPSRMIIETDGPAGSRSSPTSTPCICEAGLIVTWSRSAAIRSSGAASMLEAARLGAPGHPEQRATIGRVGPVSSV